MICICTLRVSRGCITIVAIDPENPPMKKGIATASMS